MGKRNVTETVYIVFRVHYDDKEILVKVGEFEEFDKAEISTREIVNSELEVGDEEYYIVNAKKIHRKYVRLQKIQGE